MQQSFPLSQLILILMISAFVSYIAYSLDQHYQQHYAPIKKVQPLDDFLH